MLKMIQTRKLWIFCISGIVMLLIILSNQDMRNYFIQEQNYDQSSLRLEDSYTKVQKIFNSRCIACHACNESPCQLNLQSYAGLQRGVLETYIFDRSRIHEIQPTRLYEDADSIETWRKYGFNDIIGNKSNSVLLNAIVSGSKEGRAELPNHYPDKRQCINQKTKDLKIKMLDPRLSMPYNLPGLNKNQIETIQKWVSEGAPAPMTNLPKSSDEEIQVIEQWNNFLNAQPEGKKYKYKLTSRYLFEHLNLAHLYVKSSKANNEKPPIYYKLIRSKTNCASPDMIFTRLPGVDPGVESFFYCIIRNPGEIVNKNHLPYEISIQKLNWIKKLFIDSKWLQEEDNTPMPPYQLSRDQVVIPEKNTFSVLKKGLLEGNSGSALTDIKSAWKEYNEHKELEVKIKKELIETNKIASNPFIIYKNIPQESRYRFLLEDSYYHVMTFMKGTSCNGTMAANAVQDQFYVFFLDPVIDKKLNTWNVVKKYSFPSRYGEETGLSIINSYTHQAEVRDNARQVFNSNLNKYYHDGLPIETIWNGNKSNGDDSLLTINNPNAALTIFRHNDSVSVVRGTVGDLSKTVLIMDYTTLERMTYDLVINFDVFGSIGHMILARSFMDLIRTDAENLYLSFLPPKQRSELKQQWYNDSGTATDVNKLDEDLLTQLARSLLRETRLTEKQQQLLYKESSITNILQNKIKFSDDGESYQNAHLELVRKIVFEHLGPNIVESDPINWNQLSNDQNRTEINSILSELSKEVKNKNSSYTYFFPELSILVLGNKESDNKVNYQKYYTLILNRQFSSISLIAGENARRLPEKETITVSPKIVGYFPNHFFYVNNTHQDIKNFVKAIQQIQTYDDYINFVDTYGVNRMDPRIWEMYDFIMKRYFETDPIEAGYLDLSRYFSK